jgi:hypothetical protein
MKTPLILLLLLIMAVCAGAQNLNRHVEPHFIGQDSVNLSLNEDYDLIEDSCADIIRHGHYDHKEHRFTGSFKDVSTWDTSVVVSEGTYSPDGLKNGLFIARYSNGNLRSKGFYKNNLLNGRWETYYDDNKPALVFEAVNDTIRIIDSWDATGKKAVDNSKGIYQVRLGAISWKGKLDGGKPDGTWRAFKTDDATHATLVEEYFKKGKFETGNSPSGKYTDASRILLINPEGFTYTNIEKMQVSRIPCNGTKRVHIVRAQYAFGKTNFTEAIKMAIRPVMRKYDVKNYFQPLVINGYIDETGNLMGLHEDNVYYQDLARDIIYKLHGLPLLQPATADGKPVKQGFRITFTFERGVYHYNYRFLPIDRKLL